MAIDLDAKATLYRVGFLIGTQPHIDTVQIIDGYSTIEDAPKILAIVHGVKPEDVNIITTRNIGEV